MSFSPFESNASSSQGAERQTRLFASFSSSPSASPSPSPSPFGGLSAPASGRNPAPDTNASSDRLNPFDFSSAQRPPLFGRQSSPVSSSTNSERSPTPNTPSWSQTPPAFGSLSSSTQFGTGIFGSTKPKPLFGLGDSQSSGTSAFGSGNISQPGQRIVSQPLASSSSAEGSPQPLFGRPDSQAPNAPSPFGTPTFFSQPTPQQPGSSSSGTTKSLFGSPLQRPKSARVESSTQDQNRSTLLSPANISLPSSTASVNSSRSNDKHSGSPFTARAERPPTRGSGLFGSRSVSSQSTRTSSTPGTTLTSPARTPLTPSTGSTVTEGNTRRQASSPLSAAHDDPRPTGQDITAQDLFNATPDRAHRSPQAESSVGSTRSLSESQVSLVEGFAELGTGGGVLSSTPSVAGDFNDLQIDWLPVPAKFQYSARDETLPSDLPYYNATFQSRLRDGKRVATKITELLRNAGIANEAGSTLNRIFQTARELSQYSPPATRTVGVVGNSGQGKSSLINSLLDEQELAKTGSEGAAVTSFVTEYRYSLEQHTTSYVVEVEYLNENELRRELGQLLDDYRYLYTPKLDLKDEMLRDAQIKSATAEATLAAAFEGQMNWDPDLLKDFSDGGRDAAVAYLQNWATTLQWPDGARDGKWSATADSSQICRESIEKFMRGSIWPFVKIVRVYLKAAVLRPGLVLADLPGFRDINCARVQAARRYLAGCNEIFIVSDIKRVETDETIRDVVRQHVESSSSIGSVSTPNICIICSHGTVFDDSNVEERWKAQLSQEDKRVLVKTKLQMQEAVRGDWKNETQFKTGKIRLIKLFAAARNRKVKASLISKYPQAQPRIFCVDNKLYRDPFNLEGAELSGIPELRKFCYTIPAQALYASARNFLQNSLPTLVRSLDLWYASGMEDGSQLLLNTVSTVQLRDKIDTAENTLSDWFRTSAMDTISKSFRENRYDILRKANEECLSWNSMHPASYLAWCRNNGTHQTGTVRYLCWNTGLILPMTDAMGCSWDRLDQETENSFHTFREDIRRLIRQIYEIAKDVRAPRPFLHNILSRERAVLQILDEQFHAYMGLFRSLKRDATGGHSTSLVVNEMLPAYQECARDSGRGVHLRSKQRLHGHIQQDIFTDIFATIDAEHTHQITDMAISIREQINTICDDIDNDLRTISTADTSLSEQYPEFFRELGRVLVGAREAVGRRVRP